MPHDSHALVSDDRFSKISKSKIADSEIPCVVSNSNTCKLEISTNEDDDVG